MEVDLLSSSSPLVRARAIAALRLDPLAISSRDLLTALQMEPVPRLRLALNEILEARQKLSETDRPARDSQLESGDVAVSVKLEHDFGSLIRHELSPAIGWIRRAANSELERFPESATNAAIRKLQRRLDGLVALTKEVNELRLEDAFLSDLLVESWPDPHSAPKLISESASEKRVVTVKTDISLFCTLMSNVYQNAIDAAATFDEPDSIQVAWGVSRNSYWIRVTNRFSGQRFALADVLTGGLTSKSGHQGQGLGVITSAARQLGLSFDIEGQSGTASSVLHGQLTNV